MATILPKKDTWGEIGQALGAAGTGYYMNRSDEMALKRAVEGLKPDASAKEIVDAITGAKTYSSKAKEKAITNYVGAFEVDERRRAAQKKEQLDEQKLIREQERAQKLLDQAPNLTQEQKDAIGPNITSKGAEKILTDQLKGETKDKELTPFQKSQQQLQSKEYVELAEDIPRMETTLQNLDYARKLSKEMGLTGPLQGLIGTEKATELQGVVFPAIEGIIKIFNPVGPIPVQKLKIIQDKYGIKPTDPPWIISGKINSLERFTKQALSRAQERKQLIETYNGLVPPDVLKNFDKDTESLTDVMLDFEVQGQEAELPELPGPEKLKGKTISSPDGQKYYSDGTRWVKK